MATERFRPFVFAKDPDDRIYHAIRTIKNTYGEDVFVKPGGLTKFGRNDDVGTTRETVSLSGDETYQTSNTINTIVSTDIGDDQEVIIEGMTIDGSGDFTFVSQTATLNGTTNVSLTTPLARTTRLFNNGATDFAGTVSVFVDGGTTHLITDGTNNQSLKCSTTIANFDYWICTGVRVGVVRDAVQQRRVDFNFSIREKGKVFRTRDTFQCSTEQSQTFTPLSPCIIVPSNADFRMMATSSGTTTAVNATVYGYMATSDLNQLDGD